MKKKMKATDKPEEMKAEARRLSKNNSSKTVSVNSAITLSYLYQKINSLENKNSNSSSYYKFFLEIRQLAQEIEDNPSSDTERNQTIINATYQLLEDIKDIAQATPEEKIKIFSNYKDTCLPPTHKIDLYINKKDDPLANFVKAVIIIGVCAFLGATLAAAALLTLGLSLGIGAGIIASASVTGLLTSGAAFFRQAPLEKNINNIIKRGQNLNTGQDDDLLPKIDYDG